ncbi:LysE family translocator [Indioceanicola profundi]|uniref:LysE family translocator n=1 Tax=Indioceanicola profundi TaxID=2220096 RepID=UPI000E6ABFE0|nr:LysE family transporter [Indioceanicola profundi]
MIHVTALLFGATLGIAVGPIALLIANTGLRHGAWAGIRAGLGAATADFLYALVAFSAGTALAPLLAANRSAIEAGAALLLVVFGLWMLYGALTAPAPRVDGARPPPGRPYLTTLSLTIVNPLTVLLFMGFTAHLPADPATPTIILAAACLFLGSLAVQMLFALGGAGLAKVLKDAAWIRRLNIVSAFGIVAFGVAGLL